MKNSIIFDDDTIRTIFGHEAAEDESIERLKEYYFRSNVYSRIGSNNALRIVIGHKGTGKSALLKIAHDEDLQEQKLAIFVRPDDIDDISFKSDDINENIKLWKSGLHIIMHKKAIDYFLCEHGIPIVQNKHLFVDLASDIINVVKEILAAKKIRLDNIKTNVLDSLIHQKRINVYIDDLDRGWDASVKSIAKVSALLNALRDMSRDSSGIKFVVSLRSDVFYLVRTSDESTDKLESACVWFSWSNHEILAMLIKRIKTFMKYKCPSDNDLIKMKQNDLAYDLNSVMEERFCGSGKWENIPMHRMLMTLIRRRPRDLVKLCTLAARNAYTNQNDKIQTEDFNAIFDRYSQDRLQDTCNEYRSELSNIQVLLENMKPTSQELKDYKNRKKDGLFTYSTDELLKKIKNIMLNHNFVFHGQQRATNKDLLHFMYKIGFITARKRLDNGTIDRRFFEDQNYVSSKYTDFGYEWEVHPAFRWALAPANTMEMFQSIDQ